MLVRRQQTGFTLVELMIATVAFGVVALGLTSLFLSLQDVQRRAAYLETATRSAEQEVESLRNNNYGELAAGSNLSFSVPTSLPAPRSGNVSISEPNNGIKRIDVTVTYTDHGSTKTVKLSSLIGIIGISQ